MYSLNKFKTLINWTRNISITTYMRTYYIFSSIWAASLLGIIENCRQLPSAHTYHSPEEAVNNQFSVYNKRARKNQKIYMPISLKYNHSAYNLYYPLGGLELKVFFSTPQLLLSIGVHVHRCVQIQYVYNFLKIRPMKNNK